MHFFSSLMGEKSRSASSQADLIINKIVQEKADDLGAFAVIHHYFRDKYHANRLTGHHDFYVRSHHLFETLVGILEKQQPRKEESVGRSLYHSCYDSLLNNNPTALDVKSYILAAAQRAHAAEGYDRVFYQRLLVRVVLPKLMLSVKVSDVIFKEIIQAIPGDMLIAEQELSAELHKERILFSDLLFLLSASFSSATIDRYCYIVSQYQLAAGNRCREYQASASFLKSIQYYAEMPSKVADQKMAVIVLQALLLSVRAVDRRKAAAVLRDNIRLKQFGFIGQVLCQQSFLYPLELREGKPDTVVVEVFSLLVEAIIATGRKVEGRGLLQIFNSACVIENDEGVDVAPFLQVDRWSGDACAYFFGLLDYRSTKIIYADMLSRILRHHEHDTVPSLLIRFVGYDANNRREGLLEFCKKLSTKANGLAAAECIKKYLLVKMGCNKSSQLRLQMQIYINALKTSFPELTQPSLNPLGWFEMRPARSRSDGVAPFEVPKASSV